MKRPRKRASSVAVIDIGSNSVRLVVYESMARSLITIFNEKTLCGLGREVQTTGLLAPDAVAKALTSLRRFRALCRVMKVGRVYAIATAACRDATNGPDFIAKAERICGVPIEILSGPREAKLSALGVISGIHKPDGIVGDLGGGSLELIDVRGNRVRSGVTLPLGSLALQDLSHKSLKRAERIVKTELSGVAQLKAGRGRTFYAVGGTWRALARIHIIQSGYPLRVMHGYSIPAPDALDFARRLRRLASANMLANIEVVADARRPLLDLCGAGARIHHPRRQAEDHRVFDLRRARRPALRDAAASRAFQGRTDLRRADAQRIAVAIGAPRPGIDRMDRSSGAGRASCGKPTRIAACATPPACCRTSDGACIPTIAARRRSISSPTEISARSAIKAGPLSRCRCSTAMPA